MKYTNAIMLMIAQFLFGGTDAAAFSFNFLDALHNSYDALKAENGRLCDLLEDEMPELCAFFDPHNTGNPGTISEVSFREKVLKVYQKTLQLFVIVS